MFDEQQRIAIEISGIDKINEKQFLDRCINFDPREDLDYQLPTPIDVYNNFSSFGSKQSDKYGYEEDYEYNANYKEKDE